MEIHDQSAIVGVMAVDGFALSDPGERGDLARGDPPHDVPISVEVGMGEGLLRALSSTNLDSKEHLNWALAIIGLRIE